MKKFAILFTALCVSVALNGQELPKLSPLSKSEHVVGLTKISLQYSRPSVRGRVIWGDVVPYNEVWRLGANEPTKITTSTAMIFSAGVDSIQVLQPGTYAIFAFPAADNNWRIVINSDIEQWGAGSYDATKNIVDLKIKATENPHTETLLIDLNDVTISSASIVIAWDKIKLSIPFSVETTALATANIQNAIAEGKDLDKVYSTAANYYFNSMNDLSTALDYIDKSIAINKTFSNLFLKSRILYKKGETKEALKLAEEAHKLAQEAKNENWVSYIAETIEEWKKK